MANLEVNSAPGAQIHPSPVTKPVGQERLLLGVASKRTLTHPYLITKTYDGKGQKASMKLW